MPRPSPVMKSESGYTIVSSKYGNGSRGEDVLDTHSSLEALEVGGEDRVRYPRFLIDPLQHLHLVCHL